MTITRLCLAMNASPNTFRRPHTREIRICFVMRVVAKEHWRVSWPSLCGPLLYRLMLQCEHQNWRDRPVLSVLKTRVHYIAGVDMSPWHHGTANRTVTSGDYLCILLLCLCILIVMHVLFYIFYFHRANWYSSAILTEVFPCSFLIFKANARV